MNRILKHIILAVALLASPVYAIDVTVTFTAPQATRFAAALGKAKALKDNQVPPQPRSATMIEVKQFFIERARQIVIDIEGKELIDAAMPTLNPPAFDPT